MFVRFSINEQHDDSGQPTGIFHAVRYLRDDGKLTRAQVRVANAVFDWLFTNLAAPSKKMLSKHPGAISWYRSSAKKHLSWTRR